MDKNSKKTSRKCDQSGAHVSVTPKCDRRVAGEVLPGWTVRIPSHEEGAR
jgi:hypothetical protein